MNVCKDVCKNFIEGIFNFYLHNEQDGTKNKSFFPATVPIEDYIPGSVNQHIRLAWCYGDLGILYAIYLSGMYNKDVQMSSFALTRLRKSALRRDMRETRVRDAGFCHGSSSIAYIFNKMYYFTGEKIFKETALYWYKMIVVLGRKDQNSGEYLFFAGEDGWMEDTTLLNGVIGVGLSEISAFTCQSWSWDECVMLS